MEARAHDGAADMNLSNVVFDGLPELGMLRLDQHSPLILIRRVEESQVNVVPLPVPAWAGEGEPLGLGQRPTVLPQDRGHRSNRRSPK